MKSTKNEPRQTKYVMAIITVVVLFFCVAYIVKSFQWGILFNILKTTNLELFCIYSGIVTLLYWGIRALRWNVLLRSLNIRIPLSTLYYCSAVSLSLSLFTPFQSGEILKIELLKKYGKLDRLPGYGSFAIERVIDLTVVVLLAIICVANDAKQLGSFKGVYLFIIACILIGLVCLVYLFGNKSESLVESFFAYIKQGIVDLRAMCQVIVLSIIGWILVAIAWKICLYSIDISITTIRAIELTSTVTLLNVLSMIPGAIGVSEAGITEMLIQYGFLAPNAQAGALILRFYGLWTAGLGMLFLVLWICMTKMTKWNYALIPRTRVNYGAMDLIRALLTRETNGKYREQLINLLSIYMGTEKILLTPSGRGGLWYILRSLPQTKVIVPTYTCKAVIEACILAEKHIEYVEIDEETCNMRVDQLPDLIDGNSIVIATHQFGIPCDIEAIVQMCRTKGAFVVEDVAAALGTRVNGQLAGTFGDVSFFSFDSTKLINVPLKGGFIACRSQELYIRIKKLYEDNINPMPTLMKFVFLFKAFVLVVLVNPFLYRVFHLIMFQWQNRYTTDTSNVCLEINEYYRFDFTNWQAAIAVTQIQNIETLLEERRYQYAWFLDNLQECQQFKLPPRDFNQEWGCIRFPIRVVGDKLNYYEEMVRKGVDCAFSFTYLGCPSEYCIAMTLASSVLDIPYYSKLDAKELKHIVDTLISMEV